MFQLGATGSEIMTSVRDFFQLAFSELVNLWFWPIIFIGLMLFACIILFVLIGASYERRILKSVNKINNYFLSKPFITEENLVEFNLKMKKVPRVLRNAWQIYMLNREDSPTTYINVTTCIDKPLRTSSIEKNMNIFSIITMFITFFSFVAGLQFAKVSLNLTNTADILFYATIVPLIIVFLYVAVTWIAKYRKDDIYASLYDNFPLYERNLTKAVSTLPSYVDYEILFTKKEIKEGIPILQQYLEKRALVEQQELEKARENSVACEEYNFDELGIDGSLVLERAMKECETFIKTRRRLQEECDQIETEKENYRKNFETTAKDYQRKLQASRENLESLKAQQEASTNRIESNYIKKQQSDEIKKQQQLEKDNEEATAKFNEEQITLEQEIEKRQQEIEEKKNFVQQAMTLEFKHYANTLYKALSQKAAEMGNQKLLLIAQENTDLKTLINDMQGGMGPMPNVQDSLINSEEVSGAPLYEMSSADNTELEKTREESVVNEQNELAKEEELKAQQQEQAQQQNVAPENPVFNENPTQNIVQEDAAAEVPVAETAPVVETPVVEAHADPVVETPAVETPAPSTNNDDDVDGGKVMDEPVVETPATVAQETEDLDAIQKQIEEENANLQKQKQELENDINKTISKMEAPAEPVVETPAEPVVEEVKPAKPEPVVEEPESEEEPEEEAPRARSSRTTRSARRPAGRSSRTSSSRDTARKANSEIDALNAEMEKLLDSTKK